MPAKSSKKKNDKAILGRLKYAHLFLLPRVGHKLNTEIKILLIYQKDR